MINNRQAGRRRGRGNGQGNGQGGGNGPRGGGQRDNGNRIDSRARGNANQLYEKYKNLASDAQRQGDRVNTEYYLQFADHYFRVLSETRSRMEEQQQQRARPDGSGEGRYDAQPFTGSFDAGFDGQDDEFGDEGEPIRAGEQAFGEDREPRAERDGNRQVERDGNRANGQGDRNGQPFRREGRPQRDDRPQREDRPQRDGYRRDENGGEREARDQQSREQQGVERDVQQPRYEGVRDDAGRGDGQRRAPRPPRYEDAPAPVAENGAAPVEAAAPDAPADGEAPRRRGRPRRERPADEAPAAFDAALLPPSLGISPAAVAVEAEGEDKPRRRRVRAVAAEAPAAE